MATTARDLGIVLGTFVVISAIGALLGAANMGTAMTFGQLAFVAAVLLVILRN